MGRAGRLYEVAEPTETTVHPQMAGSKRLMLSELSVAPHVLLYAPVAIRRTAFHVE